VDHSKTPSTCPVAVPVGFSICIAAPITTVHERTVTSCWRPLCGPTQPNDDAGAIGACCCCYGATAGPTITSASTGSIGSSASRSVGVGDDAPRPVEVSCLCPPSASTIGTATGSNGFQPSKPWPLCSTFTAPSPNRSAIARAQARLSIRFRDQAASRMNPPPLSRVRCVACARNERSSARRSAKIAFCSASTLPPVAVTLRAEREISTILHDVAESCLGRGYRYAASEVRISFSSADGANSASVGGR